MNQDIMEATHGDFVFKVKKGYLYHSAECWVREDGELLTVGITDFLLKTSGSILELELPVSGAEIAQDGDAGTMETKPNRTFKTSPKLVITIISPASGIIKEVNSDLEEHTAPISVDPFGAGWLFKIEPSNWEAERTRLMTAEEYFPVMEEKIMREMKK
ncbi:MAG: hypothetical protein PHO01_07720 [Desulfotomaculaceae bacterium]|nr:hypothetical protein [Desulfotomaculaceae bacterium]